MRSSWRSVRRDGAPRVEGVERLPQVEQIAAAVAVERQRQLGLDPRAEQRVLAEDDLRGRAIDARDVLDAQLLAGAQEVLVAQAQGDVVLAAGAAEAEAAGQGPDVAGAHDDVHQPVAVADWLDLGVVQVVARPQDALRFVEQPARVGIALGEEQVLADHPAAGLDVQGVDPAEDPFVLLRVLLVEDVADLDKHLADSRLARPRARRRRGPGSGSGSGPLVIISATLSGRTVWAPNGPLKPVTSSANNTASRPRRPAARRFMRPDSPSPTPDPTLYQAPPEGAEAGGGFWRSDQGISPALATSRRAASATGRRSFLLR